MPIEGDKGSGCEARTVPATVHRQLCSLHDNSHWSHFEIGKTASYALEPEVRKPCLLLYGSDHLRSGKGRVASSAEISGRAAPESVVHQLADHANSDFF